MRFISIDKARGLEIDKPVFTIDAEGNPGFGMLVKEERTKAGVVRTFEMARLDCPVGEPYNPLYVTNIVSVGIVKEAKEEAQQEGETLTEGSEPAKKKARGGKGKKDDSAKE